MTRGPRFPRSVENGVKFYFTFRLSCLFQFRLQVSNAWLLMRHKTLIIIVEHGFGVITDSAAALSMIYDYIVSN